MTIPQPPGEAGGAATAALAERPPGERPEWSELTAQAKRERILQAAIVVFAAAGLEAPMHDVADAAGAGVASLYRLFESKHELFAALVIRRMDELTAAAAEAERRPGDRWSALVDMITSLVATQSPEPFINEARAVVEGRPDVDAAIARAVAAQERLLAAARTEGRLRADATVADLRLLFAATRTARRLDAGWPRMLELMLDALDGRGRGDRRL